MPAGTWTITLENVLRQTTVTISLLMITVLGKFKPKHLSGPMEQKLSKSKLHLKLSLTLSTPLMRGTTTGPGLNHTLQEAKGEET